MLKAIVIIIVVLFVIGVFAVMATAIVASGRDYEDEVEKNQEAEDDYYGLKDNEIYKDNGNPFHG